jgi:hypothetical protein
MTFKGLKKAAVSAIRKKRAEPPPPPLPPEDACTCGKCIDDDSNNVTADYGVIIVKNHKNLREASKWNKSDGPNHRGVRPEKNKIKYVPVEGVVDRLTAVLCGACFSEDYVSDEPDTSGTAASEESYAKSESDAVSPATTGTSILLRQKQFHEEELQKKDQSILTDVSFLTDGSPMDLDLNKEGDDDDMPTSSREKNLPAFRKIRNRISVTATKWDPPSGIELRRDPAPPDLSAHTRRNPMWTKTMGGSFKNKKSKPSYSESRKKRILQALNQTTKPERRRLV